MTICYLCNTDHKSNLYNCENVLNGILQNVIQSIEFEESFQNLSI